MQASAPAGVGAMAAVIGADDALVESICREVSGDHVVVPANYNSPGQIVIGGHAVAVDAAIAKLAESGVRKVVKLAVSVPSHTPLMREAANRLAEAMRAYEWREPQIPVVQNVDAQRARHRSPTSAMRWFASFTCRCAGPAACRRWSRRRHDAWPNAARARCSAGLVRRIDKSIDMHALGTPAELEAAREAWA